jgi:serine-type D-Ala-D-Ala carboxypeptidase/endopeptidase (penicillin-binding protein 4)
MFSASKRSAFTMLLILLSVFPVLSSGSTGSAAKIRQMVQNGTVILNDESGALLFAINPDKLYIPASIIKVLTAQIALDLLGENYHFKTKCYTNSDSDLIIKGCGDPYLVSDEIRLFAQQLKASNCKRINKLLLDHTGFSNDLSIPGISKTSNPYDALNGALVVNFNTINICKDSSGNVFSAEKETPLTPLAIEKATTIASGTQARINLSAQKADCNRYAAELLRSIFREQGMVISDTTGGEAVASTSDTPVCVYSNSKTLSDVLQGLLKYSNNFIANQIFFTIGIEKSGEPATMEKSKTLFEQYIRTNLKIPESELVMVEGSGISRNNQVTGNVMISLMEKFKPHVDLLSLKNGQPVKSGTLNGVSNYAGYIKTKKGLRSFVIMLNQEKSNRDAIMKLLESF